MTHADDDDTRIPLRHGLNRTRTAFGKGILCFCMNLAYVFHVLNKFGRMRWTLGSPAVQVAMS